MIIGGKLYSATCDGCHTKYQAVSPEKWMLMSALSKDGWGGTDDKLMCPDCIAKEVKR